MLQQIVFLRACSPPRRHAALLSKKPTEPGISQDVRVQVHFKNTGGATHGHPAFEHLRYMPLAHRLKVGPAGTDLLVTMYADRLYIHLLFLVTKSRIYPDTITAWMRPTLRLNEKPCETVESFDEDFCEREAKASTPRPSYFTAGTRSEHMLVLVEVPATCLSNLQASPLYGLCA